MRATGLLLSGEDLGLALDIMGNTNQSQNEVMQKQQAYNLEEAPTRDGPTFLADMKGMQKNKPSTWKRGCTVCWLLTFGFIIFIVALAVIILSITSAVATNFYSKDMSGRLVALVILAVTAAIAITMTIVGIVGLSKKKTNAMYAAASVMIVMAIIQAVILGVSVKISTEDEYQIAKSLIDTYAHARAEQPKYLDRWSATEYSLSCCGVNGPEDYRTIQIPYYFPPDISITCCDTYNPSLSLNAQEREREVCKARKQYYAEGCKGDVIRMFKDTAKVIIGVVIALIVLEIIYALIGLGYAKIIKKQQENPTRRAANELNNDEKDDKSHKSNRNSERKDEKVKNGDKKDEKINIPKK